MATLKEDGATPQADRVPPPPKEQPLKPENNLPSPRAHVDYGAPLVNVQ